MSTKTTIKRVALVAAVALTLGGFSAVSASAASATSITQVTGTGDGGVGGVAGPANSLQVVVTPDAALTTKKGYVTISGGTITSTANAATVAANGLSVVVSGFADTLTIATPTAGSLVINVYDATSGSTFSSTVSVTKTITVNAVGLAGTYSAANSTVYIATGETSTSVSADAVISASSSPASNGDTTTGVATIQVRYRDGNGSAITADSITATISSGPGTVNGQGDSATITAANVVNQYSKSVTPSAGNATFVIWANGQSGVSTITIKNNAGTVLATKTITFTGTTPASLKATVVKAYVANSNTATDKVFSVVVYDSAGNAISNPTVTEAAATGSVIGAAGSCTWNATDLVTYCQAKATVAQAALTTDASETYTFTAGTATTTASVKFVQSVVSSLSIKGPDSAAPGDKITYTFTALNANGNPIPDAAYAPGTFIASVSPSANLVSNPFGATSTDTITTVAGVATASTYAPFGGTLTLTWTLTGTAGVANSALAKTLTATTVAATTSIAGSADSALAVDAANAATDAANAAAEEASNATEAASEALAAVNALATTVASLIAGIKAQLTALTALVKKLQK